MGSIPGLGRSPGEVNGNPLQYSCLENSMDGGAWQAIVHGVTVRHNLSDLAHMNKPQTLSSLTRDRTQAPYSGSMES